MQDALCALEFFPTGHDLVNFAATDRRTFSRRP
jgi:hypothetical protein